MARGIFGLDRVYKKQVQNIKDDNFESWPESATYGYFGFGLTAESPPYVGTIDRIDFSNETTSAPGNNISQARYGLAAVSSSSYGYFGGGLDPAVSPSYSDTIDRIDFSNETTSAPGENLPQGRVVLAATSSSSYGYFGGGFAPPTVVNTIDRIDFSNETTSPVTATLPQARSSLAAVSSSSYGYFGGGGNPVESPSYIDTIDRIDFSNETTSPVTATLPQARSALAAVSSSSYGYFGGGGSGSPLSAFNTDTIDRIDFSNETTSPVTATLSQGRYGPAALSN